MVLVGSNTTATFSVTATGSGLTYQWQKNNANISGATAATYTITGATTAHAGTYRCVITNSGGASATSNGASLSFFSGTVVESFGNTSLLYNSAGYYLGSLSVPLTYGGTHISPTSFAGYSVLAVERVGGEYQALWKTPGGHWIQRVGLNGAHKSFGGTFGATQLKNHEETFAQDFNGDGVIGAMPVITTQPELNLVIVGGTAHTLRVVATDATTYQWQKNEVAISGATSASYSISSFSQDDEGIYRCIVSSSAGSVKSIYASRYLKLTPGAVTASSENFSGTRNATKWGTQDFIEGGGVLTQEDGKLRYSTTGAGTDNDWAARLWHGQALPYNQDWAVQVDVNVPNTPTLTGDKLSLIHI